MESKRINEAFKKWFIEYIQENFAQVETKNGKEIYTAGYKEGRVDALEENHEEGYNDAMQEIAAIFNQDDGGQSHYQMIVHIYSDIENHLINEADIDIGKTSWENVKDCPKCNEPTWDDSKDESDTELKKQE